MSLNRFDHLNDPEDFERAQAELDAARRTREAQRAAAAAEQARLAEETRRVEEARLAEESRLTDPGRSGIVVEHLLENSATSSDQRRGRRRSDPPAARPHSQQQSPALAPQARQRSRSPTRQRSRSPQRQQTASRGPAVLANPVLVLPYAPDEYIRRHGNQLTVHYHLGENRIHATQLTISWPRPVMPSRRMN